jgi:hypothetical protein
MPPGGGNICETRAGPKLRAGLKDAPPMPVPIGLAITSVRPTAIGATFRAPLSGRALRRMMKMKKNVTRTSKMNTDA